MYSKADSQLTMVCVGNALERQVAPLWLDRRGLGILWKSDSAQTGRVIGSLKN